MTNAPMRPFNSWDMIKIIGLLFMFVDHMGAYFFIHNLWMRSVGRGAAPIFLFLAGYASSYRFSRELLVLASIMLLSNFILGEYTQPLNILFTILGCRALFHLMEKRGKVIEKPWEWFIVLALFIVFTCFLFQYGTLGVMFAVCGYMKRRPERYSLTLQKLFLAGTLLCCAATFALFFDLTSSNVLAAEYAGGAHARHASFSGVVHTHTRAYFPLFRTHLRRPPARHFVGNALSDLAKGRSSRNVRVVTRSRRSRPLPRQRQMAVR